MYRHKDFRDSQWKLWSRWWIFFFFLCWLLWKYNPKENAEARFQLQQILYKMEYSNEEQQTCSFSSSNFSTSAPPSVSPSPPLYQITFSPDSVVSCNKFYNFNYSHNTTAVKYTILCDLLFFVCLYAILYFPLGVISKTNNSFFC